MRYPRYLRLLVILSLLLSFATVGPAICQTTAAQDSPSSSGSVNSDSLVTAVSDLTSQVQKLSLQVQELQKQIAELRQSQPTAIQVAVPTTTAAISLVEVGSSTDDVAKLLGTCDKVERIGTYVEFWDYGTSWIHFRNGRVNAWHTGDHDLKVAQKSRFIDPVRSYPATAVTYTTTPTTTPTVTTSPGVAENGSYYGQISDATGKPKTTHVNGYYRKDGTYVRGHYRSK